MDGTAEIHDQDLPDTVEFKFTHRLFSLPGCVFRKTPEGDKVGLYVPMGDVQAVLPVHQIHLEFDIPEGSEDRKLMSLAVQALQYVKQVYPGDSIPKEVLTGKSPWMVEDKYLDLAKAWVAMLTVTWKTGEDIAAMKRVDMAVRAQTPETKAILETAHADIARELDADNPDPAKVRELFEKLAQELSYIEALREKFLDIRRLQVKLKNLYSTYQSEKAVAESITRCNSLFEAPVKAFFEKFAEFDTYVVDIISILRHFEQQVTFIRGERDAFRQIFDLWEPLTTRWDAFAGGRTDAAEALVRETYRFAAQHYTQSVAW